MPSKSPHVSPLPHPDQPSRKRPLRAEGGFRDIVRVTEEVCRGSERKQPYGCARRWEALFEEAMAERDPAKVVAACERARHAIVEQICAFHGAGPWGAVDELNQALRELCVHEYKRSA